MRLALRLAGQQDALGGAGLYDGQGKKIIPYPRAEVRYLPQSLISDVPKIVAGLRVGQSFNAIPVPDPPVIRRGASGSFYDKGPKGGGRRFLREGGGGREPSRRHSQRQHDRQIARGLASPVIRREKTVRRHRAGLSGSTDA